MKITEFVRVNTQDGYKITGYKGKKTDIEIPEGVTEIGYGAFTWCKIESVILPKSLKKICTEAFSFCESLMEISFPQDSNLEIIENHAFLCCESLKEAILPYGLKKIGEFAFANCDSLVRAFIPSSVKVIEENAFEYRNKKFLITVDMAKIPSGFHPDWNMRADFELRKRAAAINPPSVNPAGISKAPLKSAVSSAAPLKKSKPATSSQRSALSGKSEAKPSAESKLQISDRLQIENMGNGRALIKCLDREAVNIEIPEGVNSIMNCAFMDCTSLISVSLPGTLDAIWANAFISCKSLKEIRLPHSVSDLPIGCFKFCETLEKINLENISVVCAEAFFGCHSLKELRFSSRLHRIGRAAIYSKTLRRIVFEGKSSDSFSKIQKGEGWLITGDYEVELVFTDKTVTVSKRG